eukprot:6125756-Alexandrium_andersonii.AAC.1
MTCTNDVFPAKRVCDFTRLLDPTSHMWPKARDERWVIQRPPAWGNAAGIEVRYVTVSYTHLTLPTICSV